MTTVLGPMRLARAYYHCADCATGFHPRDRALGIVGTSLSLGVVRMTSLAAARASFAETGDLLHDLAGVRVGAKQAERAAEALGREIAADEREVVAVEPGRAPTMYLGMDGTGVPATPGGPRNCVRCRFFITGPAFLGGLVAHSNAIGVRLVAAGERFRSREAEIRRLEHEVARHADHPASPTSWTI